MNISVEKELLKKEIDKISDEETLFVLKFIIGRSNSPHKIVANSDFNWTIPNRTATDEEIKQMLNEVTQSPVLTADEAQQYSSKIIEQWNRNLK